MKSIGVGVLALAIIAGGYVYFSAPGILNIGTGSGMSDTESIDALMASVIISAESEGTVIENDVSDLAAVEEQIKEITSGTELYEQGEF